MRTEYVSRYWNDSFAYWRSIAALECDWEQYEQMAARVRNLTTKSERYAAASKQLLPLRIGVVRRAKATMTFQLQLLSDPGDLGVLTNVVSESLLASQVPVRPTSTFSLATYVRIKIKVLVRSRAVTPPSLMAHLACCWVATLASLVSGLGAMEPMRRSHQQPCRRPVMRAGRVSLYPLSELWPNQARECR